MGKNPAFQLYPNDLLRDLMEHPLEIRGAWITILCKIHWSDTPGQLDKTLDQWAKILGVTKQTAKKVLSYIKSEKIGDIKGNPEKPNGYITVISRRMLRDAKDRETNRIRQKRHYEKVKTGVIPNGGSTKTKSVSSSSSSTPSSLKTNTSLCTKPEHSAPGKLKFPVWVICNCGKKYDLRYHDKNSKSYHCPSCKKDPWKMTASEQQNDFDKARRKDLEQTRKHSRARKSAEPEAVSALIEDAVT